MLSLLLAISLHIEAYPVGQTVNTENTITYWVVEFSALDCGGNIHRMREEVNVYGETTELGVVTIGHKQFMDKVTDRDEVVLGFLSALEECGGEPSQPLTID